MPAWKWTCHVPASGCCCADRMPGQRASSNASFRVIGSELHGKGLYWGTGMPGSLQMPEAYPLRRRTSCRCRSKEYVPETWHPASSSRCRPCAMKPTGRTSAGTSPTSGPACTCSAGTDRPWCPTSCGSTGRSTCEGREPLRSAYVELVATRTRDLRHGYATKLMQRLALELGAYDIGALSPSGDHALSAAWMGAMARSAVRSHRRWRRRHAGRGSDGVATARIPGV